MELEGDPDMGEPVGDAREKVMANLRKGSECPCCDRLVKEHGRKITGTMSRALIQLVNLCSQPDTWIHLRDLPLYGTCKGGAGFHMLRYWGLIESRINSDPKKKGSGQWRPTGRGRAFARGRATVSKKLAVYNNTVTRIEDSTPIGIEECLGEEFDYRELARGFDDSPDLQLCV